MARPIKHTVDYFPHDARASSGKTLTILEDRYKNDGYSFWFKLLETLANSQDHYYDCRNPLNWEFLQAKTHISEEIATEILNLLVDLEAIDRDLWQQNKIIWSNNLVERIADAYKNRRTNLPSKPSLNGSKPPTTVVSTDDNTQDTVVSTDDNTQRKLKETKLKETKGNKKELANLTFEEYIEHELRGEFTDFNIDEELKRFYLYWSEGKRKLQRPKSAFRNWLLKAREFKQERNGTHQSNLGKVPTKYTKPEELRIAEEEYGFTQK